MSPFERLMNSISSFFIRFLGGPPSPIAQNRCIDEELRELREEIFVTFDGEPVLRAAIDRERAAEEGVDVIVTVLGLLAAVGVSDTQINAQMERVGVKLDAKTHKTHYVDAVSGKITRRSQL